jgi:transcriptional regulator with XRE-family HTH domain
MVSQRVQEARALSELSQRDLDRLAGLSEGHVGMIESGRRENLEASTASRIAKVLGMTLEWLIDGTGEGPTPAKVRRAVASARNAAARKVA